MRLQFLLFTLLLSSFCFAQKATVSGVILDKEYDNEPLAFANIMLKGTSTGTSTDENGKYSLTVSPGSHVLVVGFLGYKTVEIPFTVKANEKKVINYTLETEGVTLDDVVLTVTVSKESEQALLQEQQTSVEIKQSIGAQEMSKKGVSDVATAVTKTTGITKQEGSGNIFVRGLGDRYNSTSMNGLPIPSSDPEKKNIDLGLFSTDIVEYISIDKVYNSKMYGDFAGGNVDIASKDYKGTGMFAIEIGSAINNNAINQDDFMLQQGPNEFGYSNISIPNNPTTAFNYENSLAPKSQTPFGGNFSIKGGESFKLGEESRLNFFATAGFENGYNYREGINGSYSAQGAQLKEFNQKRFAYNTSSTGLFNLGYSINSNHKINYNLLFINSSSQVNDEYSGFIRDLAENNNGLVRRGTYTENQLLVNQLLGTNKFSDRITLNWGASYNTIKSDMPDRTQNILIFNEALNGYNFAINTTSDNHRYFQGLTEDEIAANLALDYKFMKNEEDDFKGKITLGYNGRFKTRDFEATQFNFKIGNSEINTVVDPYNLDTFFNQPNYTNGLFTIETFSGNLEPQFYNGEQNIHAVFGNIEYQFSPKLTTIIGLRGENIYQNVSWKTQLDNSGSSNLLERNEILPSLIVKYGVNEKNNVRFGASKTYTLPQFKERALFVYEDVTEIKVGNPDLYSSEDYNVDLKWEYFPKKEEVISFTTFGKYILNPINEITLASSTNDISFLNTGDTGYAIGAEFELRKNLMTFENTNPSKLSAGFNASYMKTSQELDSEKVRDETNYNINLTDSRAGFTGASDLLLNGDLTFTKDWEKSESSIMTTLAYSYFSDRLYALGTETKGNLVDQAVGTLDFILKTKINKSFGINFAAKNLLDPEINRVQENSNKPITVLSYKKGINLSLSVNYQF